MAIIAVGGRKGGIGKSTIVGNLAGEFARMGQRVAVLDADPRHSLAAWAQQGDGMLARCVEKVEDGATTLRARVRTAEKKADIVLIDTPPGMPETAYQAALAAGGIISISTNHQNHRATSGDLTSLISRLPERAI
jgi:chromosome partitioning protein